MKLRIINPFDSTRNWFVYLIFSLCIVQHSLALDSSALDKNELKNELKNEAFREDKVLSGRVKEVAKRPEGISKAKSILEKPSEAKKKFTADHIKEVTKEDKKELIETRKNLVDRENDKFPISDLPDFALLDIDFFKTVQHHQVKQPPITNHNKKNSKDGNRSKKNFKVGNRSKKNSKDGNRSKKNSKVGNRSKKNSKDGNRSKKNSKDGSYNNEHSGDEDQKYRRQKHDPRSSSKKRPHNKPRGSSKNRDSRDDTSRNNDKNLCRKLQKQLEDIKEKFEKARKDGCWKCSDGPQGNEGPRGLRGKKGERGPPGKPCVPTHHHHSSPKKSIHSKHDSTEYVEPIHPKRQQPKPKKLAPKESYGSRQSPPPAKSISYSVPTGAEEGY